NCEETTPAELADRCKICGNPNHTTDACRVNTERIVCHRCNHPGHLAYVCGAKLPTTARGTNDPPRRLPTPTTRAAQSRTPARTRANTNVHATFLDDAAPSEDYHCHTLRRTRDRPSTPDPRVRHREGMMTGYVTIEDTEVIAIYDTGADVSLITADCLNYVAPDAVLETNIPNSLSAANGGHLSTIGTVRLRVSTPSNTQVDTFLVTTVSLTTPVILGCPTMSLLRTCIILGPDGYNIETNYDKPCEAEKPFHFAEEDPPLEDTKDQDDYLTNYKIKYINQLCLQERCDTFHYNGFTLSPTTPWFPVLYPDTDTTTINDRSLIRGQGPCNHGRNRTSTISVHQITTAEIKGSLPPKNGYGVSDTTSYGLSDTTVANYDDDDSGDEEDQLCDEDNLPPWEALRREWAYDETTPLGRPVVRASWKDSSRPPMNYRQAAARGARSTKRLTTAQVEAFQQALKTYLDRGFCTIVQNNALDDYNKGPSFDQCQQAWDRLTKGTHYEGTTVMKPKHYTPAHTVFRDNHPTTPCRIVLDYRVLNKYLLRGGRTQNDLQGTLLQLRGFRYFVASDISKAFCQMKASLYDLAYTNYTCIGDYTVLWSSVSFGTTSAPNFLECCTHDVTEEAETLQGVGASLTMSPLIDPHLYNDEDLEKVLLLPSPEAFDYIRLGPHIPKELVLLKYVDDLFNGGDTPEIATQANDFSLHLLGGHGFKVDAIKNLRSWSQTTTEDTSARSLLGYHYRGELLFVVYSGSLPGRVTTKREACSALASLYDPLGIFIEYDLKGRLIWRRICENYKSWSDPVDTNVANDLGDWVKECQAVTTQGVPRHVNVREQPLLVCTDASTDLWGVDIRCTDNTTISTRLLSRGGVFPKSQTAWTIPRKESRSLQRPSTTQDDVALPSCANLLQALPSSTGSTSSSPPAKAGATTLLPAVERRRLVEVRKLCKELDVIILHVPSALNYADSISRARTSGEVIDPSAVLNSMTTTKVVYDYRCQPEEFEEDVTTPDTSSATVAVINTDGIDLPDVDPLPDDQRLELTAHDGLEAEQEQEDPSSSSTA
ncbi:hypothetical protein FOZ62_028990, partial [Perkinsus olseni]